MEKFELSFWTLSELSFNESLQIGGGEGNWLKTSIWGTIAYEVASNWEAIKAGISDGWNGTYNNKY